MKSRHTRVSRNLKKAICRCCFRYDFLALAEQYRWMAERSLNVEFQFTIQGWLAGGGCTIRST